MVEHFPTIHTNIILLSIKDSNRKVAHYFLTDYYQKQSQLFRKIYYILCIIHIYFFQLKTYRQF